MNTRTRIRIWTWALAALCALPQASAQQATATDDIEYKPPVRGAPARRVGGSSRGIGELPVASVIAPDHVGRTISEQPSLYWFVSRRSPVRVEIVLIDSQGAKPVVEASIANAAPGIHRFSLAEKNIRLKPGEEYQWSVSLVFDDKQRSNDVMSQGALMLFAPSAELKARLASLPRAAQAKVLAAEGIWYDAVAALSEAIEENPADAALRAQRAALLERAGLKDAAAFDRRAR
jgi:hypothetical protein